MVTSQPTLSVWVCDCEVWSKDEIEGWTTDSGDVAPCAVCKKVPERIPVVPASERDGLVEALRPFAGCEITDDGKPPAKDYDWPPMGERIKDWFGWDDFQRARAALSAADGAGS